MIQSILYNLPFLFALFCILSTISTKLPSQPIIRRALLIYLIDYAILLFCYAASMQNEMNIHIITRPLFALSLASLFPLYYINLRLTTLDRNFKTHYLWILVPSVILAASTFFILFNMTPDEYQDALLYEQNKTPSHLTPNIIALYFLDLILIIVIIVELAIMVGASFMAIAHYKRKINNYYTDGSDRIKGLRIEMIFILVLAIITVLELIFTTKENYNKNFWVLLLTTIIMLSPLVILTFRSQNRKFTIQEFEREKNNSDKLFRTTQRRSKQRKAKADQVVKQEKPANNDVQEIPTSYESDEDKQTVEVNIAYIAERIVDAVEEKKLYLKRDLRITEVCDLLCTNRTYISQAINTHLGGNFSDFINRYRLEEAKRLLASRDNDNFTIESLAEEAGFSTAASMNRTFRKIENLTPHQFRQNSMR